MQEFIPLASQFAKNHTLLVITWIVVFLMTVYIFFKTATSKSKVISNTQAIALINNKDAVVIDLRSIEEFERGHIINSINLLPTDIKNHNLGKIEQHKEVPIILVDLNGINAKSLAEILAKQGFVEVYSLKEGIIGWNIENLPLVRKNK